MLTESFQCFETSFLLGFTVSIILIHHNFHDAIGCFITIVFLEQTIISLMARVMFCMIIAILGGLIAILRQYGGVTS